MAEDAEIRHEQQGPKDEAVKEKQVKRPDGDKARHRESEPKRGDAAEVTPVGGKQTSQPEESSQNSLQLGEIFKALFGLTTKVGDKEVAAVQPVFELMQNKPMNQWEQPDYTNAIQLLHIEGTPDEVEIAAHLRGWLFQSAKEHGIHIDEVLLDNAKATQQHTGFTAFEDELKKSLDKITKDRKQAQEASDSWQKQLEILEDNMSFNEREKLASALLPISQELILKTRSDAESIKDEEEVVEGPAKGRTQAAHDVYRHRGPGAATGDEERETNPLGLDLDSIYREIGGVSRPRFLPTDREITEKEIRELSEEERALYAEYTYTAPWRTHVIRLIQEADIVAGDAYSEAGYTKLDDAYQALKATFEAHPKEIPEGTRREILDAIAKRRQKFLEVIELEEGKLPNRGNIDNLIQTRIDRILDPKAKDIYTEEQIREYYRYVQKWLGEVLDNAADGTLKLNEKRLEKFQQVFQQKAFDDSVSLTDIKNNIEYLAKQDKDGGQLIHYFKDLYSHERAPDRRMMGVEGEEKGSRVIRRVVNGEPIEYKIPPPERSMGIQEGYLPNSIYELAEAIASQYVGEYVTGGKYELIDANGRVRKENLYTWARHQALQRTKILFPYDPFDPFSTISVRMKGLGGTLSLGDILFVEQYTQERHVKIHGDDNSDTTPAATWGDPGDSPLFTAADREDLMNEMWLYGQQHDGRVGYEKVIGNIDQLFEHLRNTFSKANVARNFFTYNKIASAKNGGKEFDEGIKETDGTIGQMRQTVFLAYSYLKAFTDTKELPKYDDNPFYRVLDRDGTISFFQSLMEKSLSKNNPEARHARAVFREFTINRFEEAGLWYRQQLDDLLTSTDETKRIDRDTYLSRLKALESKMRIVRKRYEDPNTSIPEKVNFDDAELASSLAGDPKSLSELYEQLERITLGKKLDTKRREEIKKEVKGKMSGNLGNYFHALGNSFEGSYTKAKEDFEEAEKAYKANEKDKLLRAKRDAAKTKYEYWNTLYNGLIEYGSASGAQLDFAYNAEKPTDESIAEFNRIYKPTEKLALAMMGQYTGYTRSNLNYFAFAGETEDQKNFLNEAITESLGRVYELDEIESEYAARGARNALLIYGIQALNGRGIGVDAWDQMVHLDIYLGRQAAGRSIVGIPEKLLENLRSIGRPMITEQYAIYRGPEEGYSGQNYTFQEILTGKSLSYKDIKGRGQRRIGNTDNYDYNQGADRMYIDNRFNFGKELLKLLKANKNMAHELIEAVNAKGEIDMAKASEIMNKWIKDARYVTVQSSKDWTKKEWDVKHGYQMEGYAMEMEFGEEIQKLIWAYAAERGVQGVAINGHLVSPDKTEVIPRGLIAAMLGFTIAEHRQYFGKHAYWGIPYISRIRDIMHEFKGEIEWEEKLIDAKDPAKGVKLKHPKPFFSHEFFDEMLKTTVESSFLKIFKHKSTYRRMLAGEVGSIFLFSFFVALLASLPELLQQTTREGR